MCVLNEGCIRHNKGACPRGICAFDMVDGLIRSDDYIMPPIKAGSLVIIRLIHVREIKTDNKRAILCVSRTYNEP